MNYLNIGGLFGEYDVSSGQINIRESGAQYKAAFLMAIDEINNKHDGIADDLLPNVTLRRSSLSTQDTSFYQTVRGMDYLLNNMGRNIDILIGDILK